MGFRKPTESTFDATLKQVAKLFGWVGYHNPDSRRSQEGFPDRVFRRGPKYKLRLIVVELKQKGKNPTPAQLEWLDSFRAAGVPVYTWRPDDWDEIEKVLKSP